MRHQNSRLRLKQKPAHARMLQRNLVTSVLLYESIRTTKKRAKVIQPMIDRLITYAKKNPPHIAIRYVNKVVTDKNASRKIMEVYKERYKNRTSGLSSIKPLGVRGGDGAELVQLTLIDAVVGAPAPESSSTPKPQSSNKKAAPKAATAKKEDAKDSEEKKEKEEKPKAATKASSDKKKPAAKKAAPKKSSTDKK